MKHNIRLKEPLKGDWQAGDIIELDCELGSDIKDKNGREIFEGHRIKLILLYYYGIERYVENTFWFGGKKLNEYDSDALEIVN